MFYNLPEYHFGRAQSYLCTRETPQLLDHWPVDGLSLVMESMAWNWKLALKPCPGHSEFATNSI